MFTLIIVVFMMRQKFNTPLPRRGEEVEDMKSSEKAPRIERRLSLDEPGVADGSNYSSLVHDDDSDEGSSTHASEDDPGAGDKDQYFVRKRGREPTGPGSPTRFASRRRNRPSESESLIGHKASTGRSFSSTYYGVSWHKSSGRWAVQIRHDGKRIHVGYFMKEEEAARAYDRVARTLRGSDTRVNFVGEADYNVKVSARASKISAPTTLKASDTEGESGSSSSSEENDPYTTPTPEDEEKRSGKRWRPKSTKQGARVPSKSPCRSPSAKGSTGVRVRKRAAAFETKSPLARRLAKWDGETGEVAKEVTLDLPSHGPNRRRSFSGCSGGSASGGVLSSATSDGSHEAKGDSLITHTKLGDSCSSTESDSEWDVAGSNAGDQSVEEGCLDLLRLHKRAQNLVDTQGLDAVWGTSPESKHAAKGALPPSRLSRPSNAPAGNAQYRFPRNSSVETPQQAPRSSPKANISPASKQLALERYFLVERVRAFSAGVGLLSRKPTKTAARTHSPITRKSMEEMWRKAGSKSHWKQSSSQSRCPEVVHIGILQH